MVCSLSGCGQESCASASVLTDGVDALTSDAAKTVLSVLTGECSDGVDAAKLVRAI